MSNYFLFLFCNPLIFTPLYPLQFTPSLSPVHLIFSCSLHISLFHLHSTPLPSLIPYTSTSITPANPTPLRVLLHLIVTQIPLIHLFSYSFHSLLSCLLHLIHPSETPPLFSTYSTGLVDSTFCSILYLIHTCFFLCSTQALPHTHSTTFAYSTLHSILFLFHIHAFHCSTLTPTLTPLQLFIPVSILFTS